MESSGVVVGVILGASVTLFLVIAIAGARAGSVGGAFQGLTIAGKAKQDKTFGDKLQLLLAGGDVKPPEPPKPPKPSGAALRMLAILQAESRLVDFLMEDIGGAEDAQIGQAVREVHKKAQAALKQHAVLEAVLPGNDGDAVSVPKGFNPSAIQVIGNVTGEPPFNGTMEHGGWRVKELKVSTPPDGVDEFVLQPAIVRVG